MGNHRKEKRLHVRISSELENRINETAKQLGVRRSELVRQALVFYLLRMPKEREREKEVDEL